jgi:hypothetical protein
MYKCAVLFNYKVCELIFKLNFTARFVAFSIKWNAILIEIGISHTPIKYYGILCLKRATTFIVKILPVTALYGIINPLLLCMPMIPL